MNYVVTAVLSSLVLFVTSSYAFQLPPPQQFHSSLSLQSFSGILNTPNASVIAEGAFQGLYTNQKESIWRKRGTYQDNYLFMVGLFNFVEIGGQFFEAPGNGRDLSGSVKITSAPLTSNYPLFPVLGAGMQDVGGGATLLQTKYLVLSEDLWRLRLSVGYGFGPDRMDGVFGGVEVKAHDWVYLLGEYDTKDWNAGIRVVLPYFWKIPIGFTATAKSSLSHNPGTIDVAVGFTVPLDFKVPSPDQKRQPTPPSAVAATSETPTDKKPVPVTPDMPLPPASEAPVPKPAAPAPSPRVTPPHDDSSPSTVTEPLTGTAGMIALKKRLIEYGFLNVRVGAQDDRILVVEYENSLFNHNELDALGVVSGMTAEMMRGQYSYARFVLKKKNISLVQVWMPISYLAGYLGNEQSVPGLAESLKESMSVSSNTDNMDSVTYVDGDDNSGMFTTSLVVFPGLTTLIGTEFGAFDYILSLKVNPQMNLWKGAMVSAQWDIPLFWSDNMDDGKVYRDRRLPTRMERLILQQGVKLLPDMMANLGGGMIYHDVYGTLNEVIWQPGDGSHRIRLSQSWGRNDTTHTNVETYLASYRYYFSPLDLSLEGTVGRFWFQDHGFKVELKRFFGDTAVSLYYNNSTTRSDNQHWQVVGMQFSFPLTPAKDMKHYYKMQVRGTEQWRYAQETTLKNTNRNDGRGSLNYIPDVSLGVTPDFTGSLDIQYLNRDRLNKAYILSHLSRLRDSWRSYQAREAGRASKEP